MEDNRFPPTPGLASAVADLNRRYDNADKRDARDRKRERLNASAPAMLAELEQQLLNAIARRDRAPVYDPRDGSGSKADHQSEINALRTIIATATGTPTGEPAPPTASAPADGAAILRDILGIIEQTDPDRPDDDDRPHLSGADVVECLCEYEARIRALVGEG